MLRRALLLSVSATLLMGLVTTAPADASTRDVLGPEVWQAPQAAYPENPSNPLAGRLWGVYLGPQDQVSAPYAAAREKALSQQLR